MSSKAELKRIQASLGRERVRLRAEALNLETARRALARERDEALMALKILSERYGVGTWSDDEPLARIIGLVADAVPPTAWIGPAPAVRPPPTRVRHLAPVPPPEPAERGGITLERSDQGFRAVCACGWKSAWTRSEVDALAVAGRHDARLHA